MTVPDSADVTPDEVKSEIPKREERYIMNPYHGVEILTPHEALDMISSLSTMLVIDERHRRHTKGIAKNQKDI
jgi:hypothetical protein